MKELNIGNHNITNGVEVSISNPILSRSDGKSIYKLTYMVESSVAKLF